MSVSILKQVQRLPISIEAAWDFFSHPRNLAQITPEYLGLKFTNELFRDEAYPGQIITYKVRPLLGIPLFWMTEITHVQKPYFFVDEQRKGPYALWHHEHHFKAIPGGVEMTDIVHYRLPFGVFGKLGAGFVRKQLDELFSYRRKKVTELLGTHLCSMIYHVTTRAEWERAKELGAYEAASLPVEGFIHASADERQVQGVLQRYFAGQHDLVKLTIDPDKLTHELKWELAPSVNEEFPHIYGPLNVDAVVAVEDVKREA